MSTGVYEGEKRKLLSLVSSEEQGIHLTDVATKALPILHVYLKTYSGMKVIFVMGFVENIKCHYRHLISFWF